MRAGVGCRPAASRGAGVEHHVAQVPQREPQARRRRGERLVDVLSGENPVLHFALRSRAAFASAIAGRSSLIETPCWRIDHRFEVSQ